MEQLILVGELNETKIAHEINLIGQRFGAFMTSQAFLFGAYAYVAAPDSAAHLRGVLMLLGLAITFVMGPSILAAKRVLTKLQIVRAEVERVVRDKTGLPMPLLGDSANRDMGLASTIFWGNATLWGVPLITLATWGLLFLRGK
ncbi:MAG TPA: hypothetical protein VFZ09_07395 [Archangium sp.]|uniref:hypothetical protein n=1 Tax=Archangium sp. TaxID=1872627 RepID=UPI002E30B357|nr:hypothetical protein [Archangium sp.]HEX5746051.1 hypothetical protein [Archangium sp.]